MNQNAPVPKYQIPATLHHDFMDAARQLLARTMQLITTNPYHIQSAACNPVFSIPNSCVCGSRDAQGKKFGRGTFCNSYCLLKYMALLPVEGDRWRVVSMVLYKPDDFTHVELPVEDLVPDSDIFRLRRILPVSLHLPSKQAPHQGIQTTSFIFLSSEVSDK